MRKEAALLCAALLCISLAGCSSATSAKYDADNAAQETSDYPTTLSGFSSLDLNGNTVDDGVFSCAEITIVNFWATYCGPCINEMPDLQTWNTQLPTNVQMIGVVCDVPNTASSTAETARSIVEQAGVEYTNVIAQGQLATYAESLVGVPTTVLVDSSGSVVAGPIVGANLEGYKIALQTALSNVAL